MHRALVLGAGGLAAIAWETGLLAGLRRHGVDLTDADLVVGTSAGSTVAAQLGGLRDLDELVAAQLDPATGELAPDRDPERIAERAAIWEQLAEGADPMAARRRIGRIALTTSTVDEAERRAVVVARLAGETWPERPLLVVAVDAITGERVVLHRDSGVRLVDAVAASCAVPGMWPPVTIGSRRYVDGGVHSGTNADLAFGTVPGPASAPGPAGRRPPATDAGSGERTGRRASGADLVVVLQAGDARPDDEGAADALSAEERRRVLVLRPDDAYLEARGEDPLHPSVRPGCVRAGLAQAARVADEVGARWSAVSTSG